MLFSILLFSLTKHLGGPSIVVRKHILHAVFIWYSVVWLSCNLFRWCSVGGRLGYFRVFVCLFLLLQTLLQQIALCVCVCIFFLANCWDRSLNVGLLDQRVNASVVLLDIAPYGWDHFAFHQQDGILYFSKISSFT